MNKRVIAVLGCTLLALSATFLWVPTYWCAGWTKSGLEAYEPPALVQRWNLDWQLVWDAGGSVRQEVGPSRRKGWWMRSYISWPHVLIEQAMILLLGGGLLTWVIRRERRRATLGARIQQSASGAP